MKMHVYIYITKLNYTTLCFVYGLNIVTVARNGARFGARRKQQNPGKSMTYVQRGFPKIRHTQPPCASVFSFPSWSYKNEAWSWIILARLWVQIWNSHWLWCLVFGLVFGFQYSSNLGGWPLTRSWPRLQKGKQSKTGVFLVLPAFFHLKCSKQTVTEARIGARFGARQTGKKSTIWCTANRKIKHDLVHGKPGKKTRIGARFGARSRTGFIAA